MKTCIAVGAGAIAGTGAGAAAYVALELDIDKRAFRAGSEVFKRGDKTEVLQDLERINKTQRDNDTAAQYVAIGAGLMTAVLVSTALKVSIPDYSGLDQEEVRPGYVVGRPQRDDLRPDTNPLNPGADSVSHTYREGADIRET